MKVAITFIFDIGHFLALIPVVEYLFKGTKISIDGYTLREKCPNTDQKKTLYLDTFHTVIVKESFFSEHGISETVS